MRLLNQRARGGRVMGLANEPNLELWSKNEIDSHPRRVNIRPPEI